MKNKYLVQFLVAFFVFPLLIYVAFIALYNHYGHGYIVGDWLINFKGGFTRRGLGGYLIDILSSISSIKLNYLTAIIQIILLLGLMGIFYLNFYKRKINLWFIFMAISPVTLLFPVIDRIAVGRKELLLFFVYACFIYLLNKAKLKINFLLLTFGLILTIGTFFHELLFFYIPYFVLAIFISSKQQKKSFNIVKSSLIISGSFIAMVLLYFYGKDINGSLICEELMQKGLPSEVCGGILSWPNSFWISDVFYTAKLYNYFWTYSISMLLGLIPFLLFVKNDTHSFINIKNFLIVFTLLFLFSMPLFVLAVDWGRWINVHFIMLLLTSTLLLEKKDTIADENWDEKRIEMPKLFKIENRSINMMLIVCFMVSYLMFFNMQHYGLFEPIRIPNFSENFTLILSIIEQEFK